MNAAFIAWRVSDELNLSFYELVYGSNRCRDRDLVFGRQVAMTLCHEILGMNDPQLAEAFHRDRSTARYSRGRIRDLCDVDPSTEKVFESLRSELTT